MRLCEMPQLRKQRYRSKHDATDCETCVKIHRQLPSGSAPRTTGVSQSYMLLG